MNPLSPLALIAIKAIAILALVAGAFAWGHSRGDDAGYDRGHAEALDVQHRWDQDRERMSRAALAESEHHAQNEAAIVAEKEKVVHDAQVASAERDAAVASAAAAHRSLLDAARAAAADSRRRQADGDSATVPRVRLSGLGTGALSPGIPSLEQPADVLVDVLDGTDQAAGDLALYADQLAGSLGACRAEYEAVRAHSQ